jgi:hypothetical protein
MMKKKGPDDPERNKSAFHLYSNITMNDVEATNPDTKLGEIAHIVCVCVCVWCVCFRPPVKDELLLIMRFQSLVLTL